MSERIDRKRACILAWSALLAIPLALIFVIGWPWLEHLRVLQREIEIADDQIARYHRMLLTLPALEDELRQVSNNPELKDFYFNAKTRALAGAQLQREVQGMVKDSGGRVTSTQLLPSSEDEQPPTVRVRTQIQGTTDELLDVLYQIEKARPFLFVDQLTVRAPPRRRQSKRNPRSRGRLRSVRRRTTPGMLTVRLDVFGYALEGKP